MRNLRTRFKAYFFWLPLVGALLLNPGRNGINIPRFSVIGLSALAVCGVLLMFYASVAFIQPRRMQHALLPEPAGARHLVQAFLSLILGLTTIYYAAQGAGFFGHGL